ncbi:DUF308 domain-containing protein [Variovorax sp. NFACC27]|uniref:DUF308 domain-containing protein n=1 Tax=unclassified Variovorax TaxID=663243 RepID=UPI00089CC413|nr:Short repeat of unknown function [Variovorax sp. NFACC28]SEG87605.1 Short repeat of unknown function [Variovorax sp. NFACC29]SFD28183.1 Short repeat of unknown function [Variovorax sp. NFACC26]SFG33963.1 Short repeat of unknown function [Variovorax sp. NFACC27]
MSDALKTESQRAAWLRNYYLVRAAFSFAWVAAVFTVARQSPALAAVLLIVYPAWDALANLLDVRMTGGVKANATQLINIWISALVTLAVAGAFVFELKIVLAIFGVWAIVAGLLQLATAVRRRRDNGGQWVMMLSGAQSALAGGFFVAQQGGSAPVLQTIGGYAAVGAVYFLISGLIVLFRESRRGARGLASGKG